jgi:gas vesicle protein
MAQQTSARRSPAAAMPPARRATRQAASTAADETTGVASTAVASGQEVARSASQDVKELATTLREQAGQVSDEVRDQLVQLVDEARSLVQSRADAQTEKLAQGLRRLANKAGAVAQGWPNEESSVGQYVWQLAERLDAAADEIELRGVDGLVEGVQSFARRNPTAFIVGAAVLGFGVGRLIRAGSGGDDETAGDDDVEVDAVAYEELGAG